MARHYDVIILGAGNAGFGASAVLAEAGRRVAMVENRDFGGTCPNRGCTPKKFLVAAAHSLHEIERAHVHCIEVAQPKLDWAALIERTQGMIASIPGNMRELAGKRGDVYEGKARFVSEDKIDVDGEVLSADHFIIATGSTPRSLPIAGSELMITSDDVLSEREQPAEVVFVGGGVIAMEFSHVYARAGTRVTILEAMPRLLPALDADAVEALAAESRRIGIEIVTEAKVNAIERDGERLRVRYELDGERRSVSASRVINGAGRVANVAGLDLEKAGIRHEGGRIAVDGHLRSVSQPRAWVAGDALTGVPQLSPLATEEGRFVGRNIVDGTGEAFDYAVVPSVVYTVPALASVGLDEAAAKEQGRKVDGHVNDMSEWFSALTYAETVAWSRVLVDRESDAIVGAQLVGHNAEELIHLFSFAMQHGITATRLKQSRYAFPTFSADLPSML